MESDQEFSLRLINEYRRLEILWNPGYPGYFYKDKKEDAWDLLSERMGKSVEVLKAKMDSLKGSYRREKTRTKNGSGTGKGRSEVYKSRWFAFESFQFLDDKDTPRRTVSNVRNVSEDDDIQIISNNNLPNEDETPSSVDQQFVNAPLPPRAQLLEPNHAINQITLKSPKKRGIKRKTAEQDDKISEAFGYLKRVTENPKDQYTSFAEYIVHKIRTLPLLERVIAMQRINTILFEMEMNSMSQNEQPTYTPLLTNQPSTSSTVVHSTLHCEQPTYTPLLTNQPSTSSAPVHSTLHCEQPTYTPLLTNQPSTSSAPVHSTLHCEQPTYAPLLTNQPSTSSAPVHSTLHCEQPTYTPLLTNQPSTSSTPTTVAVPPQTLFNPFNYYPLKITTNRK